MPRRSLRAKAREVDRPAQLAAGELAQRKAWGQEVVRALATCGDSDAHMITLVYGHGLTHTQIATELDVPPFRREHVSGPRSATTRTQAVSDSGNRLCSGDVMIELGLALSAVLVVALMLGAARLPQGADGSSADVHSALAALRADIAALPDLVSGYSKGSAPAKVIDGPLCTCPAHRMTSPPRDSAPVLPI